MNLFGLVPYLEMLFHPLNPRWYRVPPFSWQLSSSLDPMALWKVLSVRYELTLQKAHIHNGEKGPVATYMST